MRPDAYTYASCLAACTRLLSLQFGKQVHVLILKKGFESDVWVGSALLDMYAKCRCVGDAHKVFDKLPNRNLVTWTTMMTGYAQNEHALEALALFNKFQQTGISPNQITFASILGACTRAENLEQGKQIHAHIIKNEFEVDVHVGSAVVDMYAKCRSTEDASKAFQRIPERDLVLWTAMVTGYARNWEGELALKTFCLMQKAGMKPNQFTFPSVIGACTCLTALEQGKQVHCSVLKSSYESDVCVGSTLIDMYAKCGSVEDAQRVFNKMGVRNVISWTAMIVGYAQHGLGKEALQLFEQMQSIGMKPDRITFVGVLSACSNAGLVDRGRQFFVSMSRDYGVTPEMEHYVCMVDLLGRAGFLDEAKRFIRDMIFEPDALIWQTFLSACRIHGNLELGEQIADYLFVSEPQKVQTYVLLSNIYAACGRWEDVAKVRRLMRARRLKKEPGSSWIEVKNRVHVFVVDDR